MQKLPTEFIDELRTHYDIVELIAQYVQLKRSGRNYFGLCPFHAEKTPSFSVSQDKQIFHCFGCGEGGNIYSFLMKIEGLTFPEAVRQLAERAGIPLPQIASSPVLQKAELAKNRLRQIMQLANRYFQYKLQQPGGEAARQYLQTRGVTEAARENFALGWTPDAWRELKTFLLRKGYQEKELLTSGLIIANKNTAYDRFRGRIIYPIANPQGEVIAFGGRALGDEQPKYLNSPETPIFDKSKTLYALHLARDAIRRNEQAIIFEGYMDVIAAHQAGIRQAVASLGTSLTESQARLLRNQAKEVVIVYDADAAGQAATWRGLQILREAGCLVKVGILPQGLDPDDYLRRFSGEAFQKEVIEQALLLVDYQLNSLAEQYNIEKDDERIRLFVKIIDVLAAVDNAMEREDYVQKAANLLQLPPTAIREELAKKKQPVTRPQQQRKSWPKQAATEKAPLQILVLWARFPFLIAETAANLDSESIPEELREVFTAAQITAAFSPALLLDLLPSQKYRQLISRLLIEDDYDEKTASKALADCVKYLKCVHIAQQRKEVEAQMAKLDAVAAKGEITELSRKWLELRKMEESINQAKEGGTGVG
ncbi:MAG TPA: DNA primase [Oscillospiraceae bacterium]|nr:DNA primase [Oscillospiraceae bacterium]